MTHLGIHSVKKACDKSDLFGRAQCLNNPEQGEWMELTIEREAYGHAGE